MKTPSRETAWARRAHDLWRGVANAWECDELGHLNVRFYAAKALEAFNGLVEELGVPNGERIDPISAARPTRLHLRYLREARPGQRLTIRGGVTRADDRGLEAGLEIRDALDETPLAGVLIAAEHADPTTGRSFPWPKRFAERAAAFTVAPPAHITPRGLAPVANGGAISAQAADAAGLAVIGRGVFHTDEMGADRRLRPEAFIGRSSDASGFLYHPALAQGPAGLDVAVVEARLEIHRRPVCGDRFVIRAGVAEVRAKTVHSRHWFLDPATGAPWADFATVAAFFDLKARRAATAPGPVAKALRAMTAPALADEGAPS